MVGVCESTGCQENAKYKCPGCGFKSCSNQCVNIHKKQFGCTGKKSITFVPKSKLNLNTLIEDKIFLQQKPTSIPIGKCVLSRKQKEFKKRVPSIKFMNSMSRQKLNDSYIKDGVIHWKVEIVHNNEKEYRMIKEDEFFDAKHLYFKTRGPRYISYDYLKTFGENLKGIEILEFPVVYLFDQELGSELTM